MCAGLPHRRAQRQNPHRAPSGWTAQVDTVCPYCGVGCQLTYNVRDQARHAETPPTEHIVSVTGRNGPANAGRLCVKGRFGFRLRAPPGPPDPCR
jgi:predicted molibdopterin-dependent oxidoreductase YjgC